MIKFYIIALAWLLSMMAMTSYWMSPAQFAKEAWANENLINELSDACKIATNPEHCFGIGLSISNAETQMGNARSSHWYFGRMTSSDKSANWFVWTYNRKYNIPSKYNEWGMFYWYSEHRPAPTRYCMSETSSNSQWHCPNGRRHFNTIYFKYTKAVMRTIEPPLSDNIAEPIVLRPTGRRCRLVYTTRIDWETIQADTLAWKFINWWQKMDKGTKIFTCYLSIKAKH